MFTTILATAPQYRIAPIFLVPIFLGGSVTKAKRVDAAVYGAEDKFDAARIAISFGYRPDRSVAVREITEEVAEKCPKVLQG